MSESLTPARIEQTSAWLGVFRDSRLPGMVNVSSQSLAEAADVIDALATALAEAKAEGIRQGLEEAAKVATGHADAMEGNPPTSGERVASRLAVDILALRATAPAETQKPETGESHHGN